MSDGNLTGAGLARDFHADLVGPLLASAMPGLRYAAGRLGSGSDVVGLDDAMSRDHDWGNLGYLDGHHGQPRPSSRQPDDTLPGPTPLRLCSDRRRTSHRPNSIDANRLTLMTGRSSRGGCCIDQPVA